MKKLACRYAIIQFMPYPETGEFANAGIVLACPKTGFFSYKLEKKKYARVTNFFEELGPSVYLEAMKHFEAELSRIKSILAADVTQPQIVRNVFDHLVHPREAIVRFGEQRAIMAESPEEILDVLFDHYVGRKFVTKEYQETKLARRVAGIVNSLKLELPFREEKLGPNEYPVSFPLVQKDHEGEVMKLIKPLYLGQDEPNKIYTHGELWIAKVRRLKTLRLLPTDALFAVESPNGKYEKRVEAANSIVTELSELGVKVVNANAMDEIQEFAAS